MTWTIVLEKVLSASLAGSLVFFLDWRSLVVTFIVLGQGHFLTAYVYQAGAGKIGRTYLASFAAWAAIIVTSYWLHPFPAGLTAIATIYFGIHMATDELYLTRLPIALYQSPLHLGRLFEMLPLILVYAAAVSDAMLAHGAWLQFPTLSGSALKLAEASYLAYLLVIWPGGYRPDGRSAYLIAAGAGLYVASRWGYLGQVPAPKLSGFFILFHYFNWYIHYFLSLARSLRALYLKRVAVINLGAVSLYLASGTSGPGWIFFQEQNFYIWTLLHLITTTRYTDVKNILRWPESRPA
ncbi:hypothetical protein IV102_20555 [bacterium]|nr:hypothetical protein [bacterium]